MLGPIQTFKAKHGDLRYFLAPMAGITDIIFRTLMREMGAQIVISELVSSEGLIRGGEKTRDLMAFCEKERPVGIQLFGSNVQSITDAAKMVQDAGADFVDINFGCPVKKVVCDGGGAAWLKDPLLLAALLKSVKSALTIPLTIKVRTGWDDQSRNALEVVKIAADCGVSWVAIHGRTRAQGYSGLADWELIKQVAQNSPIPVIGNGDILTANQAIQRIQQGYSHGVMIGRGALKNPWIFQDILGHNIEDKNFLTMIIKHFELAESYESKRAFLSLKKFMGWYAAGLPNSSQFRFQIFRTRDVLELRKLAIDFFSAHTYEDKVIDDRPFLMGGDG